GAGALGGAADSAWAPTSVAQYGQTGQPSRSLRSQTVHLRANWVRQYGQMTKSSSMSRPQVGQGRVSGVPEAGSSRICCSRARERSSASGLGGRITREMRAPRKGGTNASRKAKIAKGIEGERRRASRPTL